MKLLVLVPALLALTACAGGAATPEPTPVPVKAPEPAPVAPAADPTKETSTGYAIGVKKMTDARAELQTLLDTGKLADLHKTAEQISATAKALPSSCESLGDAQKADVAAQSQKLQDLFGALDEAGDAGKKDESAAAVRAYDAPIAALKAYLP